MDTRLVLQVAEGGFELAGVAALVIGSVIALIRSAVVLRHAGASAAAYRALREGVGRAILIGLEYLVAADIIRSVALEPTFESVGVLGLLVVVRTVLSWSLEMEITGEWPWQRRAHTRAPGAPEDLGDL